MVNNGKVLMLRSLSKERKKKWQTRSQEGGGRRMQVRR
jgi:hypothetical protein